MDELDRAIGQIRSDATGKNDHAELWAELDRDNEVRRAYREQGLEPPTTWDKPSAATDTGSSEQRVAERLPKPIRKGLLFLIAVWNGFWRAVGVGITWALVAAAVYWAGAYVYDWQYGPLSTSRYENFDVGVWVTPSEGDAIYLGVARGAEACNATAWDYARRKGYGRSEWGYVCCTHRNGSTCYEKIR